VSSLQLTEDPDRVRSFGGYNTGLSGIDLQDRLIARGHCIPIIFMTGYPDDNVRARAMKAGAVCFLNKPLREDHFIGCIEKALKAA
jgi:FixJ family two-component response regulator